MQPSNRPVEAMGVGEHVTNLELDDLGVANGLPRPSDKDQIQGVPYRPVQFLDNDLPTALERSAAWLREVEQWLGEPIDVIAVHLDYDDSKEPRTSTSRSSATRRTWLERRSRCGSATARTATCCAIPPRARPAARPPSPAIEPGPHCGPGPPHDHPKSTQPTRRGAGSASRQALLARAGSRSHAISKVAPPPIPVIHSGTSS